MHLEIFKMTQFLSIAVVVYNFITVLLKYNSPLGPCLIRLQYENQLDYNFEFFSLDGHK